MQIFFSSSFFHWFACLFFHKHTHNLASSLSLSHTHTYTILVHCFFPSYSFFIIIIFFVFQLRRTKKLTTEKKKISKTQNKDLMYFFYVIWLFCVVASLFNSAFFTIFLILEQQTHTLHTKWTLDDDCLCISMREKNYTFFSMSSSSSLYFISDCLCLCTVCVWTCECIGILWYVHSWVWNAW